MATIETVAAPAREPIDLPRFSPMHVTLRAPKLPTGLGKYSKLLVKS